MLQLNKLPSLQSAEPQARGCLLLPLLWKTVRFDKPVSLETLWSCLPHMGDKTVELAIRGDVVYLKEQVQYSILNQL